MGERIKHQSFFTPNKRTNVWNVEPKKIDKNVWKESVDLNVQLRFEAEADQKQAGTKYKKVVNKKKKQKKKPKKKKEEENERSDNMQLSDMLELAIKNMKPKKGTLGVRNVIQKERKIEK